MIEALIGGILVLIGIVVERYWHRKDTEREQERQKLALARSLLFEIDGFYAYYLREVWKTLEKLDPTKDLPPAVKSLGPDMFPVYSGNTSRLGELDPEIVHAIIHFYRSADAYLSSLRDYKASLERDLALYKSISSNAEARIHLGHMKAAAPELTKLAYVVCHMLSHQSGFPFEYPKVFIAAEILSIESIRSSLGLDGG